MFVPSSFCECGRPLKWKTLTGNLHHETFKELLILTKCFRKPAVVAAGVEHNLFNGTQKWPMLVEILNIQAAHSKSE